MWDNYTVPRSDITGTISTVIDMQTYQPQHDTLPATGSELPWQQDICTLSQAVMRTTLDDDGWLMVDGAPVILPPPLELHAYLPSLYSALTIGSQGSMYFTDESLLLGESWRECYAPQ